MKRLLSHVAALVAIATLGARAQGPPGARGSSERAAAGDERLSRDLRTGQYADATRLIDQLLADEPHDDLKNVRALFAGRPNMRIRHRPSRFACDVSDTGVRLPVSVGGSTVQWLADTGANVSMISDAEAARLGLAIRDSSGRVADLAGGGIVPRTAIARRLQVGRTELRDVFFIVLPADQMTWKELPPGRQAILGLPTIIALEELRWTRSGSCQIGSVVPRASRPDGHRNLRYEGLQVIAQVDVEGRTTDFVLDTGNQAGTQLWERFGKDFEPVVKERGRKGSVRVTQIGGANDREVVLIPDLRLKVGGTETSLAEAHLFSKPVGDDRHHRLLGMDVLSQAAEVAIDFRSMTLTLRR